MKLGDDFYVVKISIITVVVIYFYKKFSVNNFFSVLALVVHSSNVTFFRVLSVSMKFFTQLAFTSSDSTMGTQDHVRNLSEVKNNDTRTTSLKLFQSLYF